VNPVTLQEMEDGVVDKGVYSKYCNDIIHFTRWMHGNELAWFTDNEDDDNQDKFKEGKDPMSPELFCSICKWLLGLGNLEGIFRALFIVLTWNLVCCGNNTAKIRLSHLQWSVFDALTVNFKHTKTDQQGNSKQKKWHLFSNVLRVVPAEGGNEW
jgi:hypothetical protein